MKAAIENIRTKLTAIVNGASFDSGVCCVCADCAEVVKDVTPITLFLRRNIWNWPEFNGSLTWPIGSCSSYFSLKDQGNLYGNHWQGDQRRRLASHLLSRLDTLECIYYED